MKYLPKEPTYRRPKPPAKPPSGGDRERELQSEILELKTAYAAAISQRDAYKSLLYDMHESVRKYMAEQRNEEEAK